MRAGLQLHSQQPEPDRQFMAGSKRRLLSQGVPLSVARSFVAEQIHRRAGQAGIFGSVQTRMSIIAMQNNKPCNRIDVIIPRHVLRHDRAGLRMRLRVRITCTCGAAKSTHARRIAAVQVQCTNTTQRQAGPRKRTGYCTASFRQRLQLYTSAQNMCRARLQDGGARCVRNTQIRHAM